MASKRCTKMMSINPLLCMALNERFRMLARFPRCFPQSLVTKFLRRSFNSSAATTGVLHGLGRGRSCFYFLEFFVAARNRAARLWSVWPTIRAGLACGIVKLKLDLAGSRKRPRLVFGQWQFSSLLILLSYAYFDRR